MPADPIVSFDHEQLILVDPDDNVLGYETKARCHLGDGVLHRAFSVFLFDKKGRLLLQQRAAHKSLWPLVWANSCCSHPRRNESGDDAALRRTREELGIETTLEFLFKFQYQARFDAHGSENELCSVYVGRLDSDPEPNTNEIAALKWMSPAELEADMSVHPLRYTPWLKIEWRTMRRDHWSHIERLWRAS